MTPDFRLAGSAAGCGYGRAADRATAPVCAGVPLARAYEDIYTSIVTKTSAGGRSLSSVTAPWINARMLAQLDMRPGQSVLEIGSGGYQAALLRELVGPEGSVTTVDIDPGVTACARACLDLAGYGDVRTLCADGEYGTARSTGSSSPCRPVTSRRPGRGNSPRTAGWWLRC